MPIAADFHGLRDTVVASVDSKLAESIRLSPMKGAATDPKRPQVTIIAMLRTGATKGSGIATGAGAKSFRSRIAAGGAELHIDRTRYPDIVAVKGDVIRALSRSGQPAYEVMHVDDRNHARLILELGEK